MEDYHFFADLLSTFRSLNDWLKALIVSGFYGTLLGAIFLLRRCPPQAPITPDAAKSKEHPD